MSATRLELSTRTIPTAPLGADTYLPIVSDPDVEMPGVLPGDTDDEMRAGMAIGQQGSVLPYTRQDDYSRELVDVDHTVAVLENDRLRAEFLPGLGGRLWSLTEKTSGRELLYSNAAIQPGGLALRGAWFAGGVEWNCGLRGHSALTNSPLHTARVELADGEPMLRMWEYERLRGVVYQLDVRLPPGSDDLVVAVHVTNPWPAATVMYWWSNIAVPCEPRTRVVVPAERAWKSDYRHRVSLVDVPGAADGAADVTRPGLAPEAADYFFDLERTAHPWIAAVGADGNGLLQTSTAQLRGRKLFVWGDTEGGRTWQRWLSPRGGEYAEIQAGLARTQFEHLAMPASTRWSWVETYGSVTVPAEMMAGPFDQLRSTVADVVAGRSDVEALLSSATEVADTVPAQPLCTGSGWWGLELRRATGAGEPSTPLPGTPAADPEPGSPEHEWLALLADGGFAEVDPQVPVRSYQVSPTWRDLLAQDESWLGRFHYGIALAYAGQVERAYLALRESRSAAPSAWVWWALGSLACDEAETDEAAESLTEALRLLGDRGHSGTDELRPTRTRMAMDAATAVAEASGPVAGLAIIDAEPEPRDPSLRVVEARLALNAGDIERAAAILDPPDGSRLVVPQHYEGSTVLDDLWFRYRAAVLAAERGVELDADLRADLLAEVRRTEPLPAAYDFRMKREPAESS